MRPLLGGVVAACVEAVDNCDICEDVRLVRDDEVDSVLRCSEIQVQCLFGRFLKMCSWSSAGIFR